MSNAELAIKRAALGETTRKIAGLSAMALMTSDAVKKAALLQAEITDELTRRELVRNQEVTQ